jgi:glycosyltransferase involved in cell wall biosynthesis
MTEVDGVTPVTGFKIMTESPIVTVIIPCRNEERYIGLCLDSLLASSYEPSRLEILVMDGQSHDRSAEIVRDYSRRHPAVRLVENPDHTTPWAMNRGIREAKGTVIIKADAHSTFSPDYISLSVRYLNEFGADDIGGVLDTVPGADSTAAEAIAVVLASRFGAGNSYFRIGTGKPRWVDTVAYGCYRRDVFERVGYYNTHLARIQDIDLNRRLRKAGGRILLHPALRIRYYASPDIRSFFLHNFTDGVWAILPAKWGSYSLSPRHLAPLGLVIGFISLGILSFIFLPFAWTFAAMLFLYVLIAISIGIRGNLGHRGIKLTPYVLCAFAVRHFGYGIGSLWGVICLVVSGSFWRRLLRTTILKLKKILGVKYVEAGL